MNPDHLPGQALLINHDPEHASTLDAQDSTTWGLIPIAATARGWSSGTPAATPGAGHVR